MRRCFRHPASSGKAGIPTSPGGGGQLPNATHPLVQRPPAFLLVQRQPARSGNRRRAPIPLCPATIRSSAPDTPTSSTFARSHFFIGPRFSEETSIKYGRSFLSPDFASRLESNVRSFPSGERAGNPSNASLYVKRVCSPVLRLMRNIS